MDGWMDGWMDGCIKRMNIGFSIGIVVSALRIQVLWAYQKY